MFTPSSLLELEQRLRLESRLVDFLADLSDRVRAPAGESVWRCVVCGDPMPESENVTCSDACARVRLSAPSVTVLSAMAGGLTLHA